MGFLIDMIDVGQGDAFLLTLDTSRGEFTVLIDGGLPEAGPTVSNFVDQSVGGHLHVVIGTHLDNDHIGGLISVVEKCRIDNFYLNLPPNLKEVQNSLIYQRLIEEKKAGQIWDKVEESLKTASSLLDALSKKGLKAQPILIGDNLAIDDITLSVLNPTSDRLVESWNTLEDEENPLLERLQDIETEFGLREAPSTNPMNNSGVVIELEYKQEPYALFTADVDSGVLKEVTNGKQYPYLKVPHHGSKSGLDEELVAQIRPERAYIPVGDNNHGHPAIEILDLLRTYGAKTFCSQKTKDCRRDCPKGGFGNLCHRKDKDFRSGWTSIDPTKCINNR